MQRSASTLRSSLDVDFALRPGSRGVRLGAMVRRSGFAVLFFALVSGLMVASGQAPTQSSSQTNQVAVAAVDPVMPKDPNAVMLLAARVNGLAGLDKPWHLKANYQTFDADGKPKDTGVFEEWWAGAEKYKVSYSDPDFHQVQYKNGDKTQTLGDSGWPTMPREMVRAYLNDPLPGEKEMANENYSANEQKLGKVDLRCIEPRSAEHVRPDGVPDTRFCFDRVLPVIRLEGASRFLYVLFNQDERIDGHYLAQQIEVGNGNLPIVNIEVTSLETLSSVEEAMFAPAPAARPGPGLARRLRKPSTMPATTPTAASMEPLMRYWV